jgi:hypothetical protein
MLYYYSFHIYDLVLDISESYFGVIDAQALELRLPALGAEGASVNHRPQHGAASGFVDAQGARLLLADLGNVGKHQKVLAIVGLEWR